MTFAVAAAWPFATYYCPFWPTRAVERYEGPFNKTLANPILIIGNTVRTQVRSYHAFSPLIVAPDSLTLPRPSWVQRRSRKSWETTPRWYG